MASLDDLTDRPFTEDDKKKCARIYFLLTGEDERPKDWNPAAAAELAKMVYDIQWCTGGVRLTLWALKAPKKIPPGWGWLAGISWHLLTKDSKFRAKKGHTKIAKGCLTAGLRGHQSKIEDAILLGY